jgi:Cytochrome c554 and c-prime
VRLEHARSAWPLVSLGIVAFVAGAPAGCGHGSSGGAQPTYLDRDTMLDPQTCANCHADHYQDWAGSMHAYASDDPVFLAMNARGQRETNGQLGSFCVACHAPMALNEGATTDGTNLATVPQKLKGITCFFCHTIDAVTGSHDAAVSLADDLVMRGEYSNPVANSAHASTSDALHDRDRIESAGLCGACHDIVSPPGAAIERTYAEWQTSIFADPSGGETCAQCHMNQSTSMEPIAQAPNAIPRYYHAHDFPSVDVALDPSFPNAAAEQQAVQSFLQTTLQTALCVTQQGAVRVIVDNVSAGHFFPSGAAQDRRVFAEVIASQGGQPFYRSGVVPAGTPVVSIPNDPDLWLLRDCMFAGADGGGGQVDMFWQAVSTEGNELPMPVTTDKTSPNYYKTHVYQTYPRNPEDQLTQMPDQVTLRIRVQPIGLDVLNDLVSSGDLDAGVASAMPTFDVTSLLTWTAATANLTYSDENGNPVACVSATGFNVAADKFVAAENAGCSP